MIVKLSCYCVTDAVKLLTLLLEQINYACQGKDKY